MEASLAIGQFPIGPCAVLGGAIASVSVKSEVIFKPHRFVYGGPWGTFDILDFKIGENSQWISSGGVPADCFPPYLKAVAESGGLFPLYFDVIQVAMDVTFVVKNRTSKTAEFRGIVYGRCLDGEAGAVPVLKGR